MMTQPGAFDMHAVGKQQQGLPLHMSPWYRSIDYADYADYNELILYYER